MSLRKLNYLYVTCVLLVLTPLGCGKTEWIDPHSMDEDPQIQCNCPPSSNLQVSLQSSTVLTSYYIRTVNLILKSLRYHNEVYSGRFEMEIVKEDYDFMVDFLKNSVNKDNMQHWDRMDKLLTKMFVNEETSFQWQLISWTEHIITLILSRDFAIAMGCILLLWFLYKLMYTKILLLSMVKYFMFVLYIVDYIYTWIYMLKEKELEQLLHTTYTVPPECNVKNMGYLEYFGSFFKGHDQCAKYHKTKDIDIFWSVSPNQVIGMQIGNMVLAPAEKIGSAFSNLIGGVFKNASWYMMIPTVLLVPVLLFGLILGGCVLLSFITGRGFSFNLFHLISFSFGGDGGGAAGGSGDRRSQPTFNITLPPIEVGLPERRKVRLKGEKKVLSIVETPEGRPKSKVEVEDVPECEGRDNGEPNTPDSNEDIVLITSKSADFTSSKTYDFEHNYEVIS